MRKIVPLCGLLWALYAPMGCAPAPKSPVATTPPVDYLNEPRADFDSRMAWWREARFGMFIHWGAYAIPAGSYQGKKVDGIAEWIMNNAHIPVAEYETYVKSFNPTRYNPDEWVRIAKDAGMKYIVITSKHHEGFSLWDSKVTDYDAVDYAAIHRDLLMPLKAACDREGIKLCFYHSIMDWHHPDAQAPHYPDYNTDKKSNPNFPRYVETYLKPQVRELVELYHPAVMWFDGEWIPEYTHEMGVDMYTMLRSMDPSLIINNRVDVGRNGMQGMNNNDSVRYAGDFGTPEQEILDGTSDFDWESCMTMNDTWGYASYDQNWKSARTLIHNLVDIAAKGGNYLLNVGPTAEGEIPPASVERLAAMGAWMRVNGEAIYGSRLWKTYLDGDKVRYTQTKTDGPVYAIALDWPGNTLTLTRIKPRSGTEITLLGYDKPIPYSWDDSKGLTLNLPSELQAAASRPCEHAFAFKISGDPVNL
ncbi:MAG: alpha-L-fucosidase [Bacteroidia bacterium]|nr:alpha-L-fucosidase [Bacteroidia bacterium]